MSVKSTKNSLKKLSNDISTINHFKNLSIWIEKWIIIDNNSDYKNVILINSDDENISIHKQVKLKSQNEENIIKSYYFDSLIIKDKICTISLNADNTSQNLISNNLSESLSENLMNIISQFNEEELLLNVKIFIDLEMQTNAMINVNSHTTVVENTLATKQSWKSTITFSEKKMNSTNVNEDDSIFKQENSTVNINVNK